MSLVASPDEACDQHGIKCELFAEVLRSYGKGRLRVTGTSMVPAVWPGDMLTIYREDISRVVLGQIVLFTRDRRLFALEGFTGRPAIAGHAGRPTVRKRPCCLQVRVTRHGDFDPTWNLHHHSRRSSDLRWTNPRHVFPLFGVARK